MKHIRRLVACFLLFCLPCRAVCAGPDFLFSDDRFRGKLTTENLDAIIDEYELPPKSIRNTPGSKAGMAVAGPSIMYAGKRLTAVVMPNALPSPSSSVIFFREKSILRETGRFGILSKMPAIFMSAI